MTLSTQVVGMNVPFMWWTIFNCLGVVGLITAIVLIVISFWRQSKALQKIAGALSEIAQKLDNQL